MAFAGGYNTRINGEDKYTASERGEDTSRIESKLESQMEGLHAEDHPDLVQTIKTATEAAELQKEQADEAHQKWLAANSRGGVDIKNGPIDVNKMDSRNTEDNEIDALRKLRLAQMRGRAAERAQWVAKGHGKYEKLEQESSFLEALPKHERAICALCGPNSFDGELLHSHMRALSHVHVESYFCWLDPESAPVMMAMVDIAALPALLLAKNGQVVHQLTGIDRSFTAEGVGYELGQHGMIDFEEGTHYSKVGNGCTTATVNRAATARGRARADEDDESDWDDDELDIDD